MNLKLKGDFLKELIDAIDMRPSKLKEAKGDEPMAMTDDSLESLHSASGDEASDGSLSDPESPEGEISEHEEHEDDDSLSRIFKKAKSGKGREAPLD